MRATSYTPDAYGELPDAPGVYQYYNEAGDLIYVGKAKSLKKRVSSYFSKTVGMAYKTKRMVKEIRKIEIMLVDTELDALLLENNLIKKFQPKYNILLKDDKTYPYIVITHEHFPRIFPTRKRFKNAGTYFGPFASVKAMHNVLGLIRGLFNVRTCKLDLHPAKIGEQKYKVCLEYHIGNCLGPCEALQGEPDYLKDIEQAKNILKGNLGVAKAYFKTRMQEAAEALAFERAQRYKDKLELLEKYQAKSMLVNPSIKDVDVFTLVTDERIAFVNFLKVINGAVVITKTVELKKRLEESDQELILTAIIRLREQFNSTAEEIITNVVFDDPIEGLTITNPKIGDKMRLIELSLKNAKYSKQEKALQTGEQHDKKHRVLHQLKQDLSLKELPLHIECFDNSNIQGNYPVASMVCFKEGKPAKKEYRHYHIKTVIGANDFASMTEVVGRRYKHLVEEALPLPQLIVIDGGKGQLSSAVEALKELNLYGKIPIIGIAKRLEEIYFPEDQYPLHIDKKSPALQLLQRLRDEAHRFAITFHRNIRSKQSLGTQLHTVQGFGPATAEKLLKEFKSIKKIKEADITEWEKVVGKKKAALLDEAIKKGEL